MDQVALENVMQSTRVVFVRYANSILHNHFDSEDVVQTAYLKAWLHYDDCITESCVLAWLHRIVYHECITLIRRRLRHPVFYLVDEIECEDSPVDDNVIILWLDIKQSFRQLPERLREPLLLYGFSGYTCGEIAQILSIPNGTVNSRISRARAKLWNSLEMRQYRSC